MFKNVGIREFKKQIMRQQVQWCVRTKVSQVLLFTHVFENFAFVELETHGFGQASLVCIEGMDHFDLVEKLSERDYKLTQLMLKCIKEC